MAVLQERMGPDGAAALGVLLRSLRDGIRDDVRAEVGSPRAEMHGEIGAVRAELSGLLWTSLRWAISTFVAVLVAASGIAGRIALHR